MTRPILKRLLMQQNIVQKISCDEYKQKNLTLYSSGSPANFFCLVLEGCVEVEIGKDNLKFESRAFSYFGAQALVLAMNSPGSEYRADFTAQPLTDCLVIIITQAQYMAARKASLFDGGKTGNSLNPPDPGAGGGAGATNGNKSDVFSAEWAKAETVNLSTSQTKGSFLGFLKPLRQTQSKSPDQMHLLSRRDSDSSENSMSVDVEVELEAVNQGNATPSQTPQGRTTGDNHLVYQSSQV